jgi:hypothetical protein
MPPDTSSAAISTPYGSGAFSYVAAPKWSQLPRELALIEVTAVATDADGRAYLFNRGEHPVVVLDGDGNFVASWGAGMFPGDEPGPGQTTGGRVSIFNRQGELLARWGGGDNPCSLGDFFAPHDVHVDRRGDIYVSEVTYTAGIRRGVIGEDAHTLQKFVRVRG